MAIVWHMSDGLKLNESQVFSAFQTIEIIKTIE